MKPLFNSLQEVYNRYIVESKKPEAKIVSSHFLRETPIQVTFQQLINYHDKTPQLQIAVSSYKELVTGTELVVSSENEQAKEVIDEWIRQTDFYNKFENLVATILITGNGILEKLDAADTTNVEEVDMTTIIAKKRTDEGDKTLYYEHRNIRGDTIRLGEGKMDRFIEFNLTNYSKQPWGKSLFYSLAVPRAVGRDRVTAPLVEILWSMEDAMGAMLLNNAYPITTITYAGANDQFLKKETEKWRTYKPGDKRVQKIKPEIEFFETQASSKYTDYVTHIEKAIELGTQFPHDIMTGDFTSRASSETTENIVMKKVRGFQRYLCDKLKTELFDPILEQHNINPQEAELDIAFTTQNVVELKPELVLNLFKDKAITTMEMREWYRNNTGIDLPEDKELIAQQLQDMQMQQQQMSANQKQQDQDTQEHIRRLETKLEETSIAVQANEKVQRMYESINSQLEQIKDDKKLQENKKVNKKLHLLERMFNEMEEALG
jgi:DNA-binding transcriptional MerR regulator